VLRAAVEWEIIARSPVANLKNPEPERKEIQPFAD
jgi:hypothetical protein